jgi:hypothetical protein
MALLEATNSRCGTNADVQNLDTFEDDDDGLEDALALLPPNKWQNIHKMAP